MHVAFRHFPAPPLTKSKIPIVKLRLLTSHAFPFLSDKFATDFYHRHGMCKKRSDALASSPRRRSRTSSAALTSRTTRTGSSDLRASSSLFNSSIGISHRSLQESLRDRMIIYSPAEIRSATDNFHSRRFSPSSWRCDLRGKDALIFQRELRGDLDRVVDRLSSICRSNHSCLIKLLGASVVGGDSIFVVYEYVQGSSLADCLRNPKNPSFSPLSSWISRMQVATDFAQGLEYIHQYSGGPRHPVHNRIKSSSIIVTDPDLRGKICHFGTTYLTGKIEEEHEQNKRETLPDGEVEPVISRRQKKIEGTRGYIAPEIIGGGSPSQKTDVFAFGIVLLEILTGEEPIRQPSDRNRTDIVSLIETARDVVQSKDGDLDVDQTHHRLRRWVDPRLNDSFPVEVAEKVLSLSLDCVENEAVRRPDMVTVSGRLSKYMLKSLEWADK